MTPDSFELDEDKSSELTPAVRSNICSEYLCSTQESQNGLGWEAPSRSSSSNLLPLSQAAPSLTKQYPKPHSAHKKNKQSFPCIFPCVGKIPVAEKQE